ncbi:MAG: cobaltochelatase subunit CobN [Rubrivivax sp.]|nr:cobaltochelatase subunit CobN [Rubrivivax sp.]
MHLLNARPGGFVEDEAGVAELGQSAADMVLLSSSDSMLALLAAARTRLAASEPDFPSLRLANLLQLRSHASFDRYADAVLRHARLIVVDHLGSASSWPYAIQELGAMARRQGQALTLFSGDLHADPALLAQGTLAPEIGLLLWRYLRAGGAANALQFLRAAAFHGLGHGRAPLPPQPLPPLALHAPAAWVEGSTSVGIDTLQRHWRPGAPVVALVFYRAHLLGGNTEVFDALALALHARGLNPLPLALDSLKEPVCLATLRELCRRHEVQLLLNTTAFAALGTGATDQPADDPQAALAGDAPVLQVIVGGSNREDWLADSQGLRPRDIAMQVVLPEFDGRIVTRAVGFKAGSQRCAHTQLDLVRWRAEPDRIDFVAELAQRWCRLRELPAAAKRLALVLANYPGSEGRIGSGVGLDTPASVIELLRLLAREGYDLSHDPLPTDGDALMQRLLQGVANDAAQWPLRPALQSWPLAAYQARLAALPAGMADAISARWGPPEHDPMLRQGRFMIAGVRLGKVFIGIQPARTPVGPQDYASYHDPELVPPHHYLAFYFWLREVFAVDAVAHVGKHGNLEWLPGKSLALAAHCWPDAILGPLPHLYPFIVNDPGEGAQAKRRTQAVIIDHLMPPLTRAESHGAMQALENLVDEYYGALLVDARRAALLRRQILALAQQQQLATEIELPPAAGEDALLERIDAYLCELKETQIRDGLHVFGVAPKGRQRRDTLLALARYASAEDAEGLLAALGADLLGDFDPFADNPAAAWQGARPALLQAVSAAPWRHHGDTRERLELLAQRLLDSLRDDPPDPPDLPRTRAALEQVRQVLAPRLDACGDAELRQFSRALQGRFVPAGPSGSPSRGRADVLPTGRNFYTVDTRAIPTPAAWALGELAARRLLERHLQEHGEYPRTIGLSVWGTATMRTGGDDIAQALALIGVRPRWAPGSQRVGDFEVVPRVGLQRPRVDVTLRISGLFRDAFPATVQLFEAAVQAVAALEGEDEHDNPIRARVERDAAELQAAGVAAQQARRQAGWRIFGPPPGHYGSGLDELFASGQWQGDADLAAAYLRWSSHAWGRHDAGSDARSVLPRRLAEVEVVLHNQDCREHDLLDSSDYYLSQGGMAVAVRQLSGRQPALYHGDHGNPAQPRVRTLREEIGRVVRARMTNPKWIEGVMRHGYKGAYEIAASVDYLFGFDATAQVVGDHHYAMVADAYVFDGHTRAFIEHHNPQALADILARLREAIARGLWQAPGERSARLDALALAHDERMEGGAR